MTDLPSAERSVPARFGVTARLDDGMLVVGLRPTDEMLHHGVVRLSALAFVVDAAAGVAVDLDPDAWSLTTDLSIRMRAVAAPSRVEAGSAVLRRGRRSVTCTSDVVDGDGATIAFSALGFARIPRRQGDPPKPNIGPEQAVALFDGRVGLTRPLREEAGIEVLDGPSGVLEVAAGPELRNSAGTMQGAMVALLAEAAAEELLSARTGGPLVITGLEIRYLAQTTAGPIRTRCQTLGDGPGATVRVELIDRQTDRLTSLVFAHAESVGRGDR